MLYIFDWDGTLLDSTAKIVRSMQSAIAVNGLEYREASAVQQIIGLGLPEAIRVLYPSINTKELDALRQSYSEIFIEEDRAPCLFYPSVERTLNYLRNEGHQLAVATGKSRRGLARVLNNLGMSDFFHVTRCADETSSKPDPLMLFEILEELAVPAERSVMVGDTTFDLKMANAAGVPGVGVSYGAHSLERLQACNPVMTIDCFEQLLTWKS